MADEAYTKGSLTETTNTFPASLKDGLFMYPGICDSEHEGPVNCQHTSDFPATSTKLESMICKD